MTQPCASHYSTSLKSIDLTIENFEIGDIRVNRRAQKILQTMSVNAGKTMPQIFNSKADLLGAYRFFDNNLVTPNKIIQPHINQTIERCKQQNVVLAIQDSSDIDYDYLQEVEGFEAMHSHIDKGFRIHPSLMCTADGTPLGLLSTYNYTRDKEKPSKGRNSLPIEEKESYRWLLGYRNACDLAKQAPNTSVISISDREGDIYECLSEAEFAECGEKAHLIVRCNHNRVLSKESNEERLIEKKLSRSKVYYDGKIAVNLNRKNERMAHVCVRACSLMIKAPQTCLKKGCRPISINVVMVSEVDPPKGVEGLYWVLLTTLPIESIDQIKQVVHYYTQRWKIEVYFKVLKSGLKIDSTHLQQRERIENFIAMAMVVAWRVMLATYLPREFPDATCTLVFTELEWKLAYMAAYPRAETLPENAPTLREATMYIAMLGGYQKRKAPPGIQTIWRGFVRLEDLVRGHELTAKLLSKSFAACQAKDV